MLKSMLDWSNIQVENLPLDTLNLLGNKKNVEITGRDQLTEENNPALWETSQTTDEINCEDDIKRSWIIKCKNYNDKQLLQIVRALEGRNY